MYQKVSTNLNFVDREKNTEKFWKENEIFEKSMEQRKQGETYTFTCIWTDDRCSMYFFYYSHAWEYFSYYGSTCILNHC